MAHTRIKICGITTVADAKMVADSGAEALGMVFYPASPRSVALDDAAAIARSVGPFVTTVALFVNPDPALVQAVLATVKPHVLQFHGDEDAAFCGQFNHPYIKALRVREDTDIAQAVAPFADAQAMLFDAWSDKLYGGTGKTFNWAKLGDWSKLEEHGGLPMILAGGLTPDNVAQAVAATAPYAVDVSGGVEFAPGRKDGDKMRHFVAAVRNAGR